MNDVGYTIEEIVDKYLGLREQIEQITAETKARVEPLTKSMNIIESYLMNLSNKTGQTQFGTSRGTAFLATKTGCKVVDFDKTIQHIFDTKSWHLLNKAVNKTAVAEYIEQNQIPPPGVEWTVMKEIQVRRKRSGKQEDEKEAA